MKKFILVSVFYFIAASSFAEMPSLRSDAHDAYANQLWKFLNRPSNSYQTWYSNNDVSIPAGPSIGSEDKVFLNSVAKSDTAALEAGSTIVVQHHEGEKPTDATTVFFRPKSETAKWYWAHYENGKTLKTSADRNPFDKADFFTQVKEERLWVFKIASEELAEYIDRGSYEKHVTMPGAGPGGMTIKGPSKEVIQDYLTSRPGFVTGILDGRLWVFKHGSEAAAEFLSGSVSDKHVTRVGAGPAGLTVKSDSRETIDAYLNHKPGFVSKVVDERLWVFREGSPELAEFTEKGFLDKHVTRVGIGPNRETVKSPDSETIDAYFTNAKGFEVFIRDGRIWVFPSGSSDLEEFRKVGEPAKSVTKIGEGPLGMTVKSVDRETIDRYLAVVKP